jgi:serine/threonine protein kinase
MQVRYADLIMGERIGHGACSNVNISIHKKTGEKYAIKMFNIMDKSQAAQLYKEITLLSSVDCEALIALKGAFYDHGVVGMIIEYMDRGSLEFILKESIDLSEAVLAAISFQIIWGLGYLHYENKLHRDVKPANILMVSKFFI